ncbi:hypothetical protein ABL78_6714 [Leptomonas seymouri]|uniref:Uncharacterized protein n=1 Tax=Leptomonas seymouri TaxID=5684 RepID=A0A0N1IIL9_LEPSE|nr:hypothetical protein ABL78_6714 [Leptomonas seymouri]|eukprot:KPI84228.1 hypothetical protein ABL78_6714 [Leptomonas seymouri]
MQYATCCDVVFPMPDRELPHREHSPSTVPSHVETAQSPKVLQLHPSSPLLEHARMRIGRESRIISPKLRTSHHRRHFLALIDLFVNSEAIQLSLESFALPCAYEVQIPLDLIDRQARRYNDLTELRFSLHVRHCSIKARNLYLSLCFPWGTTHYLGPLARQTVVSSARFVSDLPRCVTLVVDVDHCIPEALDAPLPCEMLLKEHVKTILENDDFCGSIAAAHVQNLVRDLPFYEAAMRRFRRWSEYVSLFAVFYGCWETVQYEENEHAALGLSCLTPPGELRLVANSFSDSYVHADVHRDNVKWRALCDLRDQVLEGSRDFCKSLPASGNVEPTLRLSRDLMHTLSSEGSFRTLNSVNYLHVLENLMGMRSVLFSELHPIQVDSCLAPCTSEELLLAVGAR